MGAGLMFLWTATRGHRLRPWRSPYLRWRLETFAGTPADTVRLRDFLRLMVSERRQLLRFVRWISEMNVYASRPSPTAGDLD
jgi:hypothetical protein